MSAEASPSPRMAAYGHHIILCGGSYCDPSGSAQRLYSQLALALQQRGLLFGPERVKRGITPCLGVCSGGPIAVVYPQGQWYDHVDEPLLELILDAIEEGCPLPAQRCFHRLQAEHSQ